MLGAQESKDRAIRALTENLSGEIVSDSENDLRNRNEARRFAEHNERSRLNVARAIAAIALRENFLAKIGFEFGSDSFFANEAGR